MKNKKLWLTITLLVLFAGIGLANTVFLKTEDLWSWRHYIGLGAVLLAFFEVIVLIKKILPERPLW
jgi:hypothetical protein